MICLLRFPVQSRYSLQRKHPRPTILRIKLLMQTHRQNNTINCSFHHTLSRRQPLANLDNFSFDDDTIAFSWRTEVCDVHVSSDALAKEYRLDASRAQLVVLSKNMPMAPSWILDRSLGC